ncbi:MAG: hypothetical protein M3334_15315, partial [Actinomycetota bacterium]|nr:hypothetical protein [Actinomycetota bacterium]
MTFILLVFGAFASVFLTLVSSTLVSLAFDFSVPEPHDGPPSRTAPAAPAPATLRKSLRVRILAPPPPERGPGRKCPPEQHRPLPDCSETGRDAQSPHAKLKAFLEGYIKISSGSRALTSRLGTSTVWLM